MNFEWRKDYLLGDDKIDAEHQFFLNLASQMVVCRSTSEMVSHTMQLYKHTREHFEREEKLMRTCRFPHYERHVEDHNKMLSSLVSKSYAIKEGKWSKIDLINMLSQWVQHITTDDLLIVEYLDAH